MSRKIRIEELKTEESDAIEASELARRVFEEFNETKFDFRGKAIEIFFLKTGKDSFLKEKEDQFFFKAVDNNNEDSRIVGICGVHVIDEKVHLRSFFVEKSFQGLGIGRKLYDRCLKEIKRRFKNEKTIFVKSVKGSIGVYKRFGFETVGKLERNEVGFLHQKMKLDL